MIYRYLLLVSIHREFLLSYIPIEHNYLGFTFLILRDSLRQQADAGSKVRWWRQQQSGLSSLMSSEDQDQLYTQAWETGYLHLVAGIPSAVPVCIAHWTSSPKTTEHQARRIERVLLKEKRAHPASSSLPVVLCGFTPGRRTCTDHESLQNIVWRWQKFYFIYGVS